MEMNQIVMTSFKNIDMFYEDIRALLEEIKYYLENEQGYHSTRNNRVIFTSSTSLDKPENWYPHYITMFLKNDHNEYFVITILIKNNHKNEFMDKPKILIGQIFEVIDEKYLSSVCIDTFYNEEWITEEKKTNNNIYKYFTSDEFEHNENGYESGFVTQHDLVAIEDPESFIREIYEEIESIKISKYQRS